MKMYLLGLKYTKKKAGTFLGVGLLGLKMDLRWTISHFRGNGIILAVLLVSNCIRWLVFGQLTPLEVQNLKAKTGYTVWEFVFGYLVYIHGSATDDSPGGFTFVDKNQLIKFGGLFLSVLLLKSFHFLCIDRSKTFFNSNSTHLPNARLLLLRFTVGLFLVNFVDIMLIYRFFFELYHAVNLRNNILVAIFGFEIFIIFPTIVSTTITFAFNLYHEISKNGDESRTDGLSPSNLKILKIVAFITNFLRFSMTVVFSVIFLYKFTFPIHILPSSYLTLKVLVVKTRLLIDDVKIDLRIKKFHRPEKDLDILDPCCIFCFDRLQWDDKVITTPNCGHSFHSECVRRWLQLSNQCPTCRRGIL